MASGKYIHSRRSGVSLRLLLLAVASLAAAVLIITCGKGDDKGMKVVSVTQLSRLIESGEDIFLLDVRTKPEYDLAHLKATDDLIPYDQLNSNLERLPKNKNTAIYCFCRSGNRSGIASKYLASEGFTKVYNVKGGIIAWAKAGFKVIPEP